MAEIFVPHDGSYHPCLFCGRKIISVTSKVACAECYDMDSCNCDFMFEELDRLPYKDYLASEHWAQVRRIKLDSVGGKCEFCSSTLLLHVHHREYPDIRVRISPRMLAVLCKRCHGLLHGAE